MKKKVFRKPLALIVVLTMIMTMLSGFATTAFAEENDVKFSVEISSEAGDGIGTVKAEVYSDFHAQLTVSGSYVNTSNAKVTVKMTDVASLGVEGTRTYTREMNFESSTDVPLTKVTDLFDKLNGTSVAFSYGEASVVYNVTGGNGQYDLAPTDSAAASAVWHAIVNPNNFEYGTKETEDSRIVIGQGSWLQIGNSVLEFEEDYNGDLVLDNFGDLSGLDEDIRGAVELNTTEDTKAGVSFFLAGGTEIALGSSYARLKTPVVFETDLENYPALEQCLKELQGLSGDPITIMSGLFHALETVITAVGAQEIVVEAGPAEETPEKDTKFSVEISSKDSSGKLGVVKGEVYPDFSAQLTVSGSNVNTSNAKVTVKMTDVASLGVEGTRTYTREMNFGSGTDVPLTKVTDLFDKLNNTSVAFSYGDASVVYNVTGGNGQYDLTPADSAAASAVWHAIVNPDNFEYGTKETEDSRIVIGHGSWLQIGNSVLEFEKDYEGDLILDNFGDLSGLDEGIRKAVALNTTEDTMEGVSFFLAGGTEIDLGSSFARLTTPVVFETELENYKALEDCLASLQGLSGDTTTIMSGLFNALETVITAVGAQEIVIQTDPAVQVSFDPNGGTGTMAPVQKAEGSTYKLPGNGFTAPQCAKFAGWEVGEESKQPGDEITLDADTVVKAVWEDDHDYGKPEYTWAGDNSEVTAVRTCGICGKEETEIASTTNEVTTEPGCETKGVRTYTATFENSAFETQTKEEDIDPAGHTPGEEAIENETPVSFSQPAYYDLVVRCTNCNDIISSERVFEGQSLKDDALDAADIADEAIREAAKAYGNQAVPKAKNAVAAAEAGVKAAKKALDKANEDEKEEAQGIYDDALARLQAAKTLLQTAEYADLADLRDKTLVELALLDKITDGELYVKESYDAYQAAYKALKDIAFSDDLTIDVLRKSRSEVLLAHTKLVLRESIAEAAITGLDTVTYTGKAFEPKPVVTLGDKTLEEGKDYEVSYTNNKNAGKATVTVTGCNTYIGTAQGTFTINKAAQKMTVTVKKQTVKLAKVKTKAQIAGAKAITVKNAKGTKTFKKVSGSKNLTINKKTGRITVKKGTKKGTYTIKFKVTAKGTANFKAANKTKSVKIVVK